MEKKEFTGVFIPAHIWDNKELIPAERMLLGEIAALSTKTGWCTAGRSHFAEWLNCTEPNVSYYTSKLAAMGFLTIEIRRGYPNRMKVVNERFYVDEVVNGTDGGSKPHLRGVVNGTDGGSKPHLPEIQYKENYKENINTLSIKKQNESQNLSDKSEEQKAPPTPAAPPADPLINAIELSMRWAQENAATVQFWFETYKIQGWTPERLKQEIGVFFSHYQTEHQDERHTCRKDPAKYFASGFLKWLSRHSKQDAAKTQQRPNYAQKKQAVNDAPTINRGVKQEF